MARLNSRHAQIYNRAIERRGHLFQDRYKAVLITSDGQLAGVIAYVLGNPVRHGLMSMIELETYAYSGYSALVGSRPPWAFESLAAVAAALGVARTELLGFVRENALQPAAAGAGLEPDQIEELDLLIRDSCRRHGIAESALRASSPEPAKLRQEICSLANSSLDLRLVDIADRLGISYRSVKRILARSRGRAA